MKCRPSLNAWKLDSSPSILSSTITLPFECVPGTHLGLGGKIATPYPYAGPSVGASGFITGSPSCEANFLKSAMAETRSR